MNHGENLRGVPLSFWQIIEMQTGRSSFDEMIITNWKPRPFVYRPPVTYDQSGSPYGIADKFHNRLNLGQCYTRISFEIKLK